MIDKRNLPALSRRGLLVGAGSMALAACSGNIIGPPPASQIYVLHPDFHPLPDAPMADWQLVIADPIAPQSLDRERIALIRAPNAMDYYANAQWNDRAPELLQGLLVEAFEKSGRIKAVGRDVQDLAGNYILELEVRNFEAYYAVPDAAPKIRVNLTATLMGSLRHDVIATMDFAHEVQADGNNLWSVTAAFTQATGAAISEIVNWTLHLPVSTADSGAASLADVPSPQPHSRRHRHHHHH